MFNNKFGNLEKDFGLIKDGWIKLENQQRNTDLYLEKYLPMQTQIIIDETLNAVLAKKNSLLKALYDHEKLKFKSLDDKIKGLDNPVSPSRKPKPWDPKAYTMPNF